MDSEIGQVAEELQVIRARVLAQEAVIHALLMHWGEPRKRITAYLDLLAERLEADLGAQPVPERVLHATREVMQVARDSLGVLPPPHQ